MDRELEDVALVRLATAAPVVVAAAEEVPTTVTRVPAGKVVGRMAGDTTVEPATEMILTVEEPET